MHLLHARAATHLRYSPAALKQGKYEHICARVCLLLSCLEKIVVVILGKHNRRRFAVAVGAAQRLCLVRRQAQHLAQLVALRMVRLLQQDKESEDRRLT